MLDHKSFNSTLEFSSKLEAWNFKFLGFFFVFFCFGFCVNFNIFFIAVFLGIFFLFFPIFWLFFLAGFLGFYCYYIIIIDLNFFSFFCFAKFTSIQHLDGFCIILHLIAIAQLYYIMMERKRKSEWFYPYVSQVEIERIFL